MKLKIVILIGLLATGCTDDKFSGVSKQEMAEKKLHCDSVKKKSPTFAAGCENVRKEIERRKNERKKK